MRFTLDSWSLKINFFSFLMFVSFCQVSAQNLISNGGFESGITGWANIAGGGGAATFGISTADKIEGAQSFQVSVSSLGTNSWSIQTLGPSWSATLYQTYSVSFWAKSSVPGARINIIQQNLNYSVTTITLTSGWVKYQYEYVAFETNPQFKMQYLSLGNYLIDGISVVPTSVSPPTGNELKTLAARCNLNFGAAVSGGALQNDADYINTLKKEFGMVVAENEMKMGSLKPTETGAYNFAAADRLVNFAMASGMKVRGHTLLWHSQMPAWVETKTWTKATLLAFLKDYITTVVGRYKGKIAEWDVANECIDDVSGNPLRTSVWFNVIGEEVLDSAFKWTNQIDPNAKLFYNDYSAETMNGKSNAVYALVSRLKSRRAPIHGVGFQSHIGYTTAPTMSANWIVQADQNIKRLGALGLEVSITELDLGIPTPFDATKYAQQATSYGNILRLALRNPSIVKTFTLWGFTDKYSWIPGFSNYRNGAALIFYDDFTPKPAYTELVNILSANCPIPTNCTAPISPSGPTTFCAGGKVDFTTNIAATYKWLRGSTQVGTASSFTASISGLYRVEIMYANGCKATSTGINVTVNPLPVATITFPGSSTICQGSSVTLTANASASYSWKQNGTTVGVLRNLVASTAGNYSVDIVDGNGCKDSSPIVPVSVLGLNVPTVTISSSATTVCSGTGITFTATGINAGTAPTYTWFRNNVSFGTGRTISLIPSNADQIVARLTAGGTLPACLSPTTDVSNVISMTVNALPQVGITALGTTTFNQGKFVVLTANPSFSFSWRNGTTILGSNSFLTVSNSGSYFVVATGSNGCVKNSNTISVLLKPLVYTNTSLGNAATKIKMNFGTMVTKGQFTKNENGYRDTVVKQFNMLFPENELKFNRTEPVQNKFELDYPDTVLAFARSNGKTSRGHCLVWHSVSQNPRWLTDRVWSTSPNRWTRNQLLAIMKNHIDSVVGHNKGKILEWDVVNEGINLGDDHPNGLRRSFWQSIIGDDYIDSAFVYAHRADPSAYLYFNEFGAEQFSSFDKAKSDSVYSLMKRLLARGIPVHGVGFQAHASVYVGYGGLSANIKRLGDLGLRVSFTETDVSNSSNPAPLWATMVRACVDNANCTSFVSWGVDDLHSWYGKDCGCLIYDTLFQPKPTVYKAIWDELNKGRDSITTARSAFASKPAYYPTPKPTVVPLVTYCQGAIARPLTASGVKLRWYTTSVGGTVLTSAPVPNTSVTGLVSYFVSQTIDWIEGNRAEIKVRVNPSPVATITASGATTICQGSSVTLTANSSSAYSWTRNGTIVGASRSFLANTSGNYVVSIIDANGCNDSSPVTIVSVLGINTPNLTITSSATTICSGTGVTFTATGTNTGTAPSYAWFRNNTQVGTGITLNITPSNGDQISARLTAGGTLPACLSPTTDVSNLINLTVKPIQVPNVTITSSATTVCSGTDVTFTASGINIGTAPTYAWFRNNTQVGTGTTINITPSNGDQITARLTAGGTLPACLSPTTDVSNLINLTVNPIQFPNVTITSSATTVCSGTDITLTATGNNTGTTPTYSWFRNNTQIGTGRTLNIIPAHGDQITARLTVGGTLPACLSPTTDVSNVINLTVNQVQVPNVNISSSAIAVCSGTGVTFTATGTNTGTSPTYVWFRNNVQISTGKSISLTPSNGDQITARLTAEGTLPTCLALTTATSNSISLTVNPVLVPSVLITSSATTVCSGTGVTFTAGGTNIGSTPTYTWFKNNVQIGTGKTISLTPANGDLVKAILTASGTCISSSPANSNVLQISVNPLVQASVAISASANPTCSNTGVTYTAVPTNGGSNPSYIWTVNGVAKTDNGPVFNHIPSHSDQILAKLSVGGTQTSCLTNTTATSNIITAQVTGTISTKIAILANATTICQGNMATFTTTASGTGTSPIYAWYINGIKQTATAATFNYLPTTGDRIFATLTPGGNGITCVLGGIATSNGIALTVQPNQTGTISIQSDKTTLCIGNVATLSATGTNLGTAPKYMWYVNGQIQSQGTTFGYTPSNNDNITAFAQSGGILPTCLSNSNATSNGVNLQVMPYLPVSVSISSSATQVCTGTSVTFTATGINGGTSPTYAWFRNNTQVGSGPTLNITPSNGYQITARLTAGGTLPACLSPTTDVSNVINLTVNPIQVPNVTISSSSTTVCSGTGVTFSATGTNTGTAPTYAWFRNNTQVGTGVTLNIIPSSGDQITARLRVGGTLPACLSPTTDVSNVINLTVNPIQVPNVNITSSATTVCSGTGVTFTATGIKGGTSPTYTWFRNNTQIGTGKSITLTPSNGDQIKARLTAGGTLLTCLAPTSATSNSISLTVNPVLIPSVLITSSATTVCSGTGVTFTASGTNIGSTPTYIWFKNNVQIGTGKTISLTPANGDLIKAILTTSGTCISSSPATSNVLQISVNPLVQASVTISASANPTCSNTGVTYTAIATNAGSNPSFVWSVNGVNQTGNGPIFNYTPSHNDKILAKLSVGGTQNTCLTNTTATSNAINAQVTGTISTSLSVFANATTICQGNTATFTTTASGTGTAPTYAWYVNGIKQTANGNTFSYTPSSGDQVMATMTPGGNGITCILGGMATSNGITLTVQPNQIGTVTIQSDKTTLCTGNVATLSALGINLGSAPNYIWYVNGQIQSQGTTFSYTPSDNDNVTAIAQAGGILPTCLSNSIATSNGVNLTVVPFMQVVVYVTSIANQVCKGTGVTFTATGINGGSEPTYTWWVNNQALSTGNLFSYTPSNGDVVQASIVIGGTIPNCLSNTSAISDELNIDVDPCLRPDVSSISGPAFVATGTSNVTYSVPNVPGDGYLWTAPAGATITNGQGTNNITVDFGNSNSGQVTLIQTNSNGSTQVQVFVTTGTPPNVSVIVGPTTVSEGSTGITYSVASLPGTNYQWTVPTGATITSGQGTSIITVDFGTSVSGSVFLVATNVFGTSTTNLSIQTAAVTNLEISNGNLETMVYPNPFHTTAGVKVISPSSETISIELHDMNGISLKSWTGLVSPVQLEVGEGFASGVYTLAIKQKDTIRVVKLVKLN